MAGTGAPPIRRKFAADHLPTVRDLGPRERSSYRRSWASAPIPNTGTSTMLIDHQSRGGVASIIGVILIPGHDLVPVRMATGTVLDYAHS